MVVLFSTLVSAESALTEPALKVMELSPSTSKVRAEATLRSRSPALIVRSAPPVATV